jgi:tetrahydromethanopterin S-methyltransferase subunit G
MTDETSADGLRDKLARQSEETLGKIAEDLLGNPLVSGALSRAFEARERAGQAQEAAMGALNLPSAADLERLTRRLRSVSQRLEGIEDAVDRLDEKLARPIGDADQAAEIDRRLAAMDETLNEVVASLSALRGSGPAAAKKPAPRKRAAKQPAAPKPASG